MIDIYAIYDLNKKFIDFKKSCHFFTYFEKKSFVKYYFSHLQKINRNSLQKELCRYLLSFSL